MMRPFEMETQADVGAQQGAAALDLAPKQGGTQTKARACWFDRDTILQEKKYYWMVRRAQDIFFSQVALIIWIDSPGASPIFSQDRVGRDGKSFNFYKFRSMVPNAEAKLKDVLDQNEMDGPVFKMKNDPRITRVGHFI